MVRWSLLMAVVLVSCTQNAKPVEVAAAPTIIDFDAVVNQVHFAWRHEGDVWASRDARWSAEWSPRGVAFTPFEGSMLKFGSAVVNGADQIVDVGNDQRGGLRIVRSNCVEEFSSGDEGIEQRWRFESKPEGVVTVTIPVDAALVATTKRGLHFKAGEKLVRYGHATWVDAKKQQTAIPARFVNGLISLEVPANVVASSEYPAVLDPILEPEQGVDAPVTVPRSGLSTRSDLVWAGQHYLMLWHDNSGAGYPMTIRGARISAAGVLLDVNGFTVPRNAQWAPSRPRLSWNGTHLLAVWQETNLQMPTQTRIVAWRIAADTSMLDASPLVIASLPAGDVSPDVTWNGTHHLVVWSNGDVFGARVSTAGALVDAAPVALVQTSAAEVEPSVASNGSGFLVTWSTGAEIQARALAADLTLSPVNTISSFNDTRSRPDVTWANTQYFVAWQDRRNATEDIYAARVSPSGVRIAQDFAVSTRTNDQVGPRLATQGSEAVIVWTSHVTNDIYETNSNRLSASGIVLDAAPRSHRLASTLQAEASVASAGTGYLVAWTEGVGTKDLYASTQTGDAMGAPFQVNMGVNLQGPPSVSAGGSNFLLAWSDTRGPNLNYAARVSATGAVLDPMGIPLPGTNGSFTHVAWNGTTWLVTVGGGSGVATRVSAAGQVLDTTPIPIVANNLGAPLRVASNGSEFLVVWSHASAGVTRGVRVSGAGVVLDATPIELTAVGQSAAVAWGGENYLVVGEASGIKAMRVSAAGAVLDATPKVISPVAGFQTFSVNLAAGPDGYLVIYREGSALAARRIGNDGDVVDATSVVVSSNLTATNALAWSGRSWVATWRAVQGVGTEQVLAARIETAGTRLDATPLIVEPSRISHSPGVACIEGRCLVTWNGWDEQGVHQTSRVFTRFLVDDAPLAIAQTVTTDEDTAVSIVDAGTPLTMPTNGMLSGTSPNFTYTPAADFHGSDSFVFNEVSGVVSVLKQVNITVTPVNDAPVAMGQVLDTNFNTPVTTMLTGSDVDADQLTFTVSTQPMHGQIIVNGASATYAPGPGFSGVDSFQFVANDGTVNSAPATVQISVHDAGTDDAGTDAGVHDAGVPDAGSDAGVSDAGIHDAGFDAGVEDAGIHDAGSTFDAGTSPDGGTGMNPPGGCGCASADGAASLLFLALGWLARRRRGH